MAEGNQQLRRLFTLEDANRSLPLVTRIIKDIVRVNDEMVEIHRQVEKLRDEGRSMKAQELSAGFYALAEEVEGFAEELEAVGCICKDPRVGLVDFPARAHDRIVFLCWRLGEEKIEFWHELEAGFAGRKPVHGLFT